MKVRVKICGVKTFDEAMQAIEAGADLLGFNFYPTSSRYITPGECLKLVVRLQTALREKFVQVTTVGVFVDANPDFIESILKDTPLDMAQLCGDEPPDVLEMLGDRGFKSLRPASPAELAESVKRFPRRTMVPQVLIDAYRPGEYGGTGHTADWGMVATLARQMPVLLAGGLRPENVAEAIQQVRPWGVDVASGVESAPGVKDPQKVRNFIAAVRACEKTFDISMS